MEHQFDPLVNDRASAERIDGNPKQITAGGLEASTHFTYSRR
jgi:hypothetical protein